MPDPVSCQPDASTSTQAITFDVTTMGFQMPAVCARAPETEVGTTVPAGPGAEAGQELHSVGHNRAATAATAVWQRRDACSTRFPAAPGTTATVPAPAAAAAEVWAAQALSAQLATASTAVTQPTEHGTEFCELPPTSQLGDHSSMNRQTDRLTDRQTDKRTDRQTDTADDDTTQSVPYSFVAYRRIRDVVWIDELYTAECVRQQGVARWLLWQIGRRQRIELQVSTALGLSRRRWRNTRIRRWA